MLIKRVPWTVQPQYITGPSPRWAGRLTSLYSLTPGTWQINQVNGTTGGSIVGTGPTWLNGKLRVSGSTSNYVLLQHGLPLNIAVPFCIVIGCERLAGSGVSWSLLRNNAAWSGWYMEAQGDVKSSNSNSFDGLVSLGGGNNYAFVHRSSTDLTGASFGALVIDTTAVAPTTVDRAEVALGVVRRSTITAGADSVFTHFAVIRGDVSDAELKSLAVNPWQLFAPRSIWVPVSVAGGTTYTITPSGGVVMGGTSVDIKGKVLDVSGGVTLAGTGSMTFASGGTSYTITPSGGITMGGNATYIQSKTFTPSGGITLGGTSDMVKTKIIAPTDGVIFGGTGSMTSNTTVVTGTVGERTKVGAGT